MSYLHYRDFFFEVVKGNVPGHSTVHKFGQNASIPNGTWAVVSNAASAVVHPSSASTVRVKAGGSAVDTSTGTGARTITIFGISTSGAEVSEQLTLNGTAASTDSTNTYYRVHRAYVETCGTYNGANVGAVTIENSTSGVDYLTVPSSAGQSLASQYTIPAGKTGYLTGAEMTVDGSKPADFRLMKRENFDDFATPFSPYRVQNYWDGVESGLTFRPTSPIAFQEKTDLWIEARGSGAGTECSADFDLVLVNNT